MLLPVVAWRQQRPEHHISCMDLEGKQLILNGFVEAESSNHSSQVSSGPYQRRHHSQLLLVHERHNSIACSFCHLHEEGEANKYSQSNIPWLGVVHGTEAKQEDCLEEKRQKLCPNATTETKVLEEDITGDSSKRAGKEVHQSKSSCQWWGVLLHPFGSRSWSGLPAGCS